MNSSSRAGRRFLRRLAETPIGRRAARWAPLSLKRQLLGSTQKHDHVHPSYSEAELLSRAEEFNRNAELHWQKIAAEAAGRKHVLNKPFSTVRDTPDIIYRLGLVLSALDLGVGHSVLDFGSGSCWLSSSINRLGCRTVSVDVSATALSLGEELFRSDSRHHMELDPQFLPYDGHKLPLPNEAVDRAVCFDSFHHVPNQDEVLAELFRVLRPGGRLVLAEPGEGHSHMDQSVYETETHGVLENDLHLGELQEKTRKAGFRDMWMKPYPDPAAVTLTADEYIRLVDGDDGVYPMHALQASLRHFYIVILTKGEPRFDSRNPRRLDATIVAEAHELHALASASVPLRVRAKNTGDTLWLRQESPVGGYVMLGGHLLDGQRKRIGVGFLRAGLPRDVAPGEELEIEASVPTPAEPGRYIIQLDMVDEFVAWFEQTGSKTTDVLLSVDGYRDSRDPHRLAATIERVGAWPEATVTPGAPLVTRLRLTNAGDTTWFMGSAGERGSVWLGVKLLLADGSIESGDYARLRLEQALEPRGSCEIDVRMPAPPDTGRFVMRFDLVAEQIAWFESYGSAPLDLAVATNDAVPDSRAPGRLLAQLDARPVPPAAAAGSAVRATVCIRNIGNTRWLASVDRQEGHVRLGAQLQDADGRLLDLDYLRVPLARDVAPGEECELAFDLPVPERAGRYRIELDLVDEGVRWFASHGSKTLVFELTANA